MAKAYTSMLVIVSSPRLDVVETAPPSAARRRAASDAKRAGHAGS